MKNRIMLLFLLLSFTCIQDTYAGQLSVLKDTFQYAASMKHSPEIIKQPISQIVCVGSQVIFRITAKGSNLSYQWRKGLEIIHNDHITSGATSSVLTISKASFLNGGDDYNVMVITANFTNLVSNCVSLKVSDGPSISSLPISQTVCAGSTISFPVVSSGINLKYQWRKGNTALVNCKSISGANSSELNLLNVTTKDDGMNYNVIITGLCSASIISANSSLTIIPKLTIEVQPVSKLICQNEQAMINVSVNQTNVSYQWRKGSVNLRNSETISGTTSSVLTISKVKTSDDATNYNVLISGSCHAKLVSAFVKLEVTYSPLIVAQPVLTENLEGKKMYFDVLVTGSNLTYQWRKGNILLCNENTTSGVNTAVLSIDESNLSDVDSNYNVIIGGDCSNDQHSLNVSLSHITTSLIQIKQPIE